MSTFNELEQQTIKEHCGDWVLYSVDELENQLAAERAQVALAVEWLEIIKAACMEEDGGVSDLVALRKSVSVYARNTLAALQSSDALADIRREVARECIDIADTVCRDHAAYNDISLGARKVVKAIRAKFGVTE